MPLFCVGGRCPHAFQVPSAARPRRRFPGGTGSASFAGLCLPEEPPIPRRRNWPVTPGRPPLWDGLHSRPGGGREVISRHRLREAVEGETGAGGRHGGEDP